jgi:trigger factor
MPNVKIENLQKNQLRLTFTLSQDEMFPYLQEAAARFSEQTAIPGFRPGKAGYDVVKQRFGEMKILEEALEPMIRKSYVEAVMAHNIETVGSPKINVEKIAPNNDLIFTAQVMQMPKVTELPDYKSLRVESKKTDVEDKELDLAIRDIQRMQTKETRAPKETPAKATDKVVIGVDIKKDGISIEGGQAPNHAIYLAEEYYIPGFKEQLVDLKEGDEKTFTLPFPENHVQKMLAGHDVEFQITVKEIFHLEPPSLDSAFASSLGMKDLAALKQAIAHNLKEEKEQEEKARQERDMLELIAKKSQFEEIPDLLLNEEINKMIGELKHGVQSHGLEFETYLSNLKKTLAQLKMDLTTQAIMRIKVVLILRAIATREKIEVEENEITVELDRLAEHHENKKERMQMYAPEYREHIEKILKNQKVIEKLREIMMS